MNTNTSRIRNDSDRSENQRSSNISSRTLPSDGSTTIRRTLIERGLRPVNSNDADGGISHGASSNTVAISTIARQHVDEQRELQELNAKFSVYLNRVQYLEDYNRKLTGELAHLKQSWGGDGAKLQSAYGPQLQGLRTAMDISIRDQILQELQLKRYEYDIWQIQQQIAALGGDQDVNRFNMLKQQLDSSNLELEHMKNQFDQRLADLARQRQLMENLLNELDGLTNEFHNQQLERLIIENELQTLTEHAAFQEAIYQCQRAEILTLNTPAVDVSSFYRMELARAISDIRQDFQVLSQSQGNELEEYYRIKTEQVREEIAAENERKRLVASEVTIESMDTIGLSSSLNDNHGDLISLKAENQQLQRHLDALIEDCDAIEGEFARERQSYEQELGQLRQEIADKQAATDNLLENNVSLRFEMSTYRRLLDGEEKHLNRMAQEQSGGSTVSSSGISALVSSGSSSFGSSGISALASSGISALASSSPVYQTQSGGSDRILNELGTKKMTVQKTARGPISFDSVDLETDSILLVNEKYSGSNQSFQNWTLRRQIDQQAEMVYQFPPTFALRPRQTIRILSKHSPSSVRSTGDILVADKIDSWGQGRKMVTRLIDDNNEEKAIITQIFQ